MRTWGTDDIVYPKPGFVMVVPVITPLVIVAVAVAVVPIPIQIDCGDDIDMDVVEPTYPLPPFVMVSA